MEPTPDLGTTAAARACKLATSIASVQWVGPRSASGADCAAASLGIYGLDRPDGGYDAETPGRRDRRAVHEPDHRVAAGVAPENVGLAVAVEVAVLDDRPGGGHHADAPGPGHRRAGHEPRRG